MSRGSLEAPSPDRRRLGPRPFPLQLVAAWGETLGHLLALTAAESGGPPGAEADGDGAAAIRLEAAAARAALVRFRDFLIGVEAYWRHPYRRRMPEVPVLWREGTTRLLDYAPAAEPPRDALPVLVVPSLVNRAYILDLSEERSLLRWLGAAGVRPLLVDWDAPGEAERDLDLTGYIAGRLNRALDATLAAVGRPPVVIGYCMGGLLALALALRRQREVAALALLATPWDFHAVDGRLREMLAAMRGPIEAALVRDGALPVDVIQALFAALDPTLAPRKFARFAALDPNGREATAFVALEDWANDGVPLVRAVAQECLWDWYVGNAPARGLWRVDGAPVRPEELGVPALVAAPQRDRIVPRPCAEPLAGALPQAETLRPRTGHVGMVAGGAARTELWEPLLRWLRRHDPVPRPVTAEVKSTISTLNGRGHLR
jgi:polyhydroxyalkanoate synthase subunit PhaC